MDNIKTDLKQRGDVDWIYVAQIGVHYWAYIHAVMECLGSTEVDNFFTTKVTGFQNRLFQVESIILIRKRMPYFLNSNQQTPIGKDTALTQENFTRKLFSFFFLPRNSRVIQTVTSFVVVYRNMITLGLKSIICKI